MENSRGDAVGGSWDVVEDGGEGGGGGWQDEGMRELGGSGWYQTLLASSRTIVYTIVLVG